MTYPNATITKKANVYYDGDVISRTITTEDGQTKTLGFMQAGTYHFKTSAAEIMEILHGECRVRLDGSQDWHIYSAGESFNVPANSGFDIEVADMLDYICHFED
ncbi:pyrimidine/purine nucleoside phosphorylase [Ghiorsea bivora]|uniref:pyrimidine/purine nucleoside phosphorylase n=1 Tax=Ghiorsea bivora TaxID=1485545 RepID=UPI00056ED340|nr:pyrimidine/purine nucleoside phosphorylase [Ghiorsea bivora]